MLIAIPDLVSEINATKLLVAGGAHGLVFHRHGYVSVAPFPVAVDLDFLDFRHSITTFNTEFIKSSVFTW
jgi:hypothetical protein